jgi:hypothetical protein
MRALSIRQPFAELILRGIKTVEYRSRPTRIIGERFWIYATKGTQARHNPSGRAGTEGIQIVGDNIAVPGEPVPAWMIELAEQIKLIPPHVLAAGLPRGVIVGSAVVSRCEEVEGGSWRVDRESGTKGKPPSTINNPPSTLFKWHLADIQRAKRLRKPKHHPQPGWFKPFG